MPKKYETKTNGKYHYKRISFALSPEEHKLWLSQYKSKGFDTLTAMIRNSVNKLFKEIPSPENKNSTTSTASVQELKKIIIEMKKEQRKSNQDFLSLNRQMLKLLANGKSHSEITKIATIQEKIFNLIKEKPRAMEELMGILGVEEVEIINRLNSLVKKDLIVFDKEEMEWKTL